jgi:hypothetical protein
MNFVRFVFLRGELMDIKILLEYEVVLVGICVTN